MPEDFPGRIVRFREAAGLSWRAMARLLGTSPYRLREWSRGRALPSTAHLFRLLTIAEGMGLREGILMRPEDMPEGLAVAERPQSTAAGVAHPPPWLPGSRRWDKFSAVRCVRDAQ